MAIFSLPGSQVMRNPLDPLKSEREISSTWLEAFAYRTDLVWWVFLGAGLVILSVGFLTVAGQSLKAAIMNPVESLRNEYVISDRASDVFEGI